MVRILKDFLVEFISNLTRSSFVPHRERRENGVEMTVFFLFVFLRTSAFVERRGALRRKFEKFGFPLYNYSQGF